ncbi:MAG: carbamoyltransferase [candidate division Zixibacteria bacterium]|nr:carbamoyltransferase [candidate division Zixibacteria bacterium]
MNILGISAFYHDSAACLVRDGEIIAAAQEERLSRLKHDPGFPARAVDYCLKEDNLTPEQIDLVAFYDKPWAKFERLLETYLAFAPLGIRSFLKAMPLWLKEKLWLENRIRKALPGFKGKVIFPEHHQSHAASAFFPSPFDRAAILTIDGVGEWTTASWGTGNGNRIELAYEMRFPHSLGLLYSAFTYYTGFRVNSGEYKVMGLAPYGRPVYVQTILDNLLDLKEDGSFRLDMKYFKYCQGLTMTSRAFHKLFDGPPRKPESEITPKEMDLAASIQAVTEEIILRMARHVRKQTGETDLCLAGGVALNCVANGRILREKIFDRIWIQPAAGDAGGALGAALFAWHRYLDNSRGESVDDRDRQRGSLLGPSWKNDDIAAWLHAEGYPFHRYEESFLLDRVARDLADKKVVGWFSGRMEFGPRALGARSILADPRTTDMLAILNLKIKFRESFRPLAPAVLAEDAGQYFELDTPSPYMLLTAPVRAERRLPSAQGENSADGIERLYQTRSDIPAVTHLDYSARIQTVDGRDNPRFHALIRKFKKLTGCGVLVNTSFNVRGEPIVCTPQEAYCCFMKTGMDILVLENLILEKTEQPAWTDDEVGY